MSDILSQAEIEALLNSLNNEGAGPAPSDAPALADGEKPALSAVRGPTSSNPLPVGRPTKHNSYEIYDFRRPDKLSKEQLRTLQMLNETFARMAASSLSGFLRVPVAIDVISLEQVPYEEYLRSIDQSVFSIISLPPLTGQAVLEIEFGIVFSMLDRLLGGSGKPISRTILTDIERPLVRQAVERTFGALKAAWEGIVIINPGIEGLETSSQFVQVAPPNDISVVVLFEIRVGTQRGAMSLCMPYIVLKPLTSKLSAQKWFVNNNRKQSPVLKRAISQQLQQTEVDCAVVLGKANLTMDEFQNMRPGDVLRLDQKTNRDITLTVANVPKFEGRPALQGKKLVFSVTAPVEE